MLANSAAAASAQIQSGAVLLVSPTGPLDPHSGSRGHHFAPVAARVSDLETNVKNFPFLELNLKDCFATGVVTSPNHPKNYPPNLERTETIQVADEKVLRLEFTSFKVHPCNSDTVTCPCDYVKVIDGDGTTLMDRGCGLSYLSPSHSYYFLPPIFTTKSSSVDIFFYTDGSSAYAGWSLNWTAVTPGLTPYLTLVSS